MRRLVVVVGVVLAAGCTGPGGGNGDNTKTYSVDAGNVTLFARRVGGSDGDAQAVVLLHGGPGLSSRYLRTAQEALASEDRAVIIYDQRGCGQSTPPTNSPNNYQLSLYAGDLESVRLAIGVGSLHLVAHDFGSLVAVTYAGSFPANVASLTLFGAAPPTDVEWDAAKIRLQDHIDDLQVSGEIPTSVPPVDGQDCSPPLLTTLPGYFSDPGFSGAELPDVLECANTPLENTLGATSGYSLTSGFSGFPHPTLALFGADDPYGTEMGQAAVDALTTTSTLELVNGCGHFWQECDSQVYGQINSFLSGLGI